MDQPSDSRVVQGTTSNPLAECIKALIDDAPEKEDTKASFVNYFWGNAERSYDEMRSRLLKYCKDEIKVQATFESRVKSRISIQKSMDRREKAGKPYSNLDEILKDLHDLVGIRIIVDFTPDLENVNRWIENTFRQDKKPNIFNAEREAGYHWTAWFGAYQCWNHHISIKPGTSKDLEAYSEVSFEIQITCLSERLYNKLAHPLLYKGQPGSMSRKDEMVIGIAHAMSLCYSMCLLYFRDELNERELIDAMKQAASQSEDDDGQGDSTQLIELISRNQTFAPKIPLSFLQDSTSKKINRQDFVHLLESPQDGLSSKNMIWTQMKKVVEEAIQRANEPSIFLPEVSTARFDNKEVQEHPRCHEGTRTSILEKIRAWIDNTEASKSMLWLFGPAGTGKSTISRTVVDQCERRGTIAASYFFRRGSEDNHRNGTSRLFLTIANQLTAYLPKFRTLLRNSLRQSSCNLQEIENRSLEKQFDILIRNPLSGLPRGETPKVIIIDALDECSETENIKKAIKLFSSLEEPTKSWIRLVFTSREAIPIHITFQDLDCTYMPLQAESMEETKQDIRKYLEGRLAQIKAEKSIDGEWPASSDLEVIIHRASSPSPLFIYAATFLRYIHDERGRKDSSWLLKRWVRQCNQNIPQLSALYQPILEDALPNTHDNENADDESDDDENSDDDYEDDLMKLLASIACVEIPLSPKGFSSLLSISLNSIRHWLGNLHPVLDIPKDDGAPINIIHASFRDYLLTKKEHGKDRFRQNIFESDFQMAEQCMERLSRTDNPCAPLGLLPHIHKPQDVSQVHSSDVTGELTDFIDDDLRYACNYWIHHWIQSKRFDDGACNTVKIFLDRHIVPWIEMMTIMDNIRFVTSYIGLLLKSLMKSRTAQDSQVINLLADTEVFSMSGVLLYFPLQTYLSALVFCSLNSQIRQTFCATQIPFVRTTIGDPAQWVPRVSKIIHLDPELKHIQIVAISAHKQVLLQYSSGELELWDIKEGVPRRKYPPARNIIALAFCEDGESFNSLSEDGQVELWDAETADHRTWCTLDGPGPFLNAAISTSSSLVIASSPSSTSNLLEVLGLWNLENGKHCGDLQLNQVTLFDILDVTFSMDGTTAAALTEDRSVYLWNTMTKDYYEPLTLPGHGYRASIGFCPSGIWLVVFLDESILFYDYRKEVYWDTPSPELPFLFHHVRLIPDSKSLIVMSDSSMTVYDLSGLWKTFCENVSANVNTRCLIKAMALSPDLRTLATSSDNHTLLLWNLHSMEINFDLSDKIDSAAEAMTFSSDGSMLAVLIGNYLKLWRIHNYLEPICICTTQPLPLDLNQNDIYPRRCFSQIRFPITLPNGEMVFSIRRGRKDWSVQPESGVYREEKWYADRGSISSSENWIQYADRKGVARRFLYIPIEFSYHPIACVGGRAVMGNSDGEFAILDFDLDQLEQYSKALSDSRR